MRALAAIAAGNQCNWMARVALANVVLVTVNAVILMVKCARHRDE
ncbi:hypothetical protein [Stenotrophomonas rhizophila]|nr:hypothetical protein [Stenotrophomonas rhizophila]